MRKPSLKLLSLCAVSGLVILSSCYKDDSEEAPRAAMLVGSWRTTGGGSDVNHNGVWDGNEHTAIDSTSMSVLTFHEDGSGVANASYNAISVTLQWQLLNNDNNLRIINAFDYNGDTTMYNIVRFTKTELVVRDSFKMPVAYLSFRKI